MRFAEVKAGKLQMPKQPASMYQLFGGTYDAAANTITGLAPAHRGLHLRRDGRVDRPPGEAIRKRHVDHVPRYAEGAHHAFAEDVTRMPPPTVGQRASRSLTLTGKHVEIFAELTGDYNPLHFDTAFAERTRFGALVVQGGLTTGVLHALVAMDLPGPGRSF